MTTAQLLNALLRPTYVLRTASALAECKREDTDPMKRGAVTRVANATKEIEDMLAEWATSNGYVALSPEGDTCPDHRE